MPRDSFADRRVLVTGATAGIGEATAKAFAAAGCAEVYITGRREHGLVERAKEWSAEGGAKVVPVAFDVRNAADVDRAASERPEAFDVDILVNNAGLARGIAPVQEGDPDDWKEVIETNVLGLLYVTRKVLPHMVARGSGHVVNLGSVAGRWTYPGGNVYSASKFAVHALTEGMRFDVHGKNVRVTTIAPGLVETEFSVVRFKGDAERAAKVYADTRVLTPDDIADCILWACSRPEHVNVQEIVVYPTDQASPLTVFRRPPA